MVAFVIFEKKYWLFVLATLSETKVRNRYPQARGRASLSLLYGLPPGDAEKKWAPGIT